MKRALLNVDAALNSAAGGAPPAAAAPTSQRGAAGTLADLAPAPAEPALDSLPCRRTDPDLWLSDNRDDIAEAKRRCRTCPVETRCRELVLARYEPYGVWGGLSAEERRHARASNHNA